MFGGRLDLNPCFVIRKLMENAGVALSAKADAAAPIAPPFPLTDDAASSGRPLKAAAARNKVGRTPWVC